MNTNQHYTSVFHGKEIAYSAASSLVSTATAQQYARGGIDRAIRCTCVISAASAEHPAAQKCRFSGFSRTSRLSFQRI